MMLAANSVRSIHTSRFSVDDASRPSILPRYALVPSTPRWLGHNRGEPLMVLDYIIVNIRQPGPAELYTCHAVRARSPNFSHRQHHIHQLAHLPLLAMSGHHYRPQTGIGQPGLPEGRRATCAGPFHSARWHPCTITSEPRGMSGKGGSGSAGVMVEETAME